MSKVRVEKGVVKIGVGRGVGGEGGVGKVRVWSGVVKVGVGGGKGGRRELIHKERGPCLNTQQIRTASV